MKITILMDNNKEDVKFRTEHGLSILIEHEHSTILFDTGKTDAFIQNAKILGKDLTKVDYVVLSHGHYDHTGGLEAFLELNKTAKVVLKPEVLEEKWSISKGYNRSIGFPLTKRFQQKNKRYIFVNEAIELSSNIWVLPQINRHIAHTFTDSYLFVRRDNELCPDTFEDELFLTVVINNKLVVFTGCAHNGVENMIQSSIDFTNITEVELVVGGTHLNRAHSSQLAATIDALKNFNIKRAAFNHCSGIQNIPEMNMQLNANVSYAFAGKTIRV